jgi:hypothetical protein
MNLIYTDQLHLLKKELQTYIYIYTHTHSLMLKNNNHYHIPKYLNILRLCASSHRVLQYVRC